MLFENDQLNISQIHNVVYYAPKGHLQYNYPGKLPTYELMYFHKGDAMVTFGEKTFHMTSGSILYLPKGIDNNRYSVSVNDDFELYNIYFDTDAKLPDEAVQIANKNDEFKGHYKKVHRIWVEKRDGYYYKSMQLTYGIFELLRRAQLRYSPNNKLSYLLPSEEYMAAHYCDMHFDYEMLINLSGLSYSYFKKIFIDKYGCPPVKYITRLKINRACELLQTKKFKVCEIAEICGFENVYYFSNVFKKQTGVSPKNYEW